MLFRIFALASALLLSVPALAQYQVPNHAVPVGRGAPNTGFKNAPPGTAGVPLTSNGAAADPSFGPISNAGLANVPALTAKCNPTASTAAVQDCTGTQLSALIGVNTVFTTRAAAIAASISPSVNAIMLTGYATAGTCPGSYIRTGTPSPAKAWHLQTADGAWWQLQAQNGVYPCQVGAKLDDATDDTVAMQAWLDYGVAFGVKSLGQPGTAQIPTGTLTLAANANVDGLTLLTFKRTSNVVAAVLQCDTQNNLSVRNINIVGTQGVNSTTSNALTVGVKVFTVAGGLTGLTPGNFMQLLPLASPTNGATASIVSYVGTTLTLNILGVVGSGTFANWSIDSYPQNGPLADSPIAIRFKTCNDVVAEGISVSGRFYNGIDTRNGSRVTFNRNYVSGVVNRGVNMSTFGVAVDRLQNTNNRVDGNFFTQYCSTHGATDVGGVSTNISVRGNSFYNCLFQGVSFGGTVLRSSIVGNHVQLLPGSTVSAGILLEAVPPSVAQNNVISGNTVVGGLNGIYVSQSAYTSVTGNNVTASNTGITVFGDVSVPAPYGTIVGNSVNGCTADGIVLTSTSAGAITGYAVTGNASTANTGYGIFLGALVTNSTVTGNTSLANGTAYNVPGSNKNDTASNIP